MVGTKRRRKGGSASSPSAKPSKKKAATAAQPDDDENEQAVAEHWIEPFISLLLDLQSTEKAAETTAALERLAQANSTALASLTESPSSISTKVQVAVANASTKPDDWASTQHVGYWIVWATHLLERLAASLPAVANSTAAAAAAAATAASKATTTTSENLTTTAQALAWLSFALAPCVSGGGTLFANSKKPVDACKSAWWGRASLAVAQGAARALPWLLWHVGNHTDNDDLPHPKASCMALLAAVLALDQMILPPPPQGTSNNVNAAIAPTSSGTTSATKEPTQQLWDEQGRTTLERALQVYWKKTQQQQEHDEDDEDDDDEEEDEEELTCSWTEPTTVHWTDAERACRQALLEMATAVNGTASTSETNAATTSTTSHGGKKQQAAASTTATTTTAGSSTAGPISCQQLHALFRQTSMRSYSLDDYASATRWVGMALTSAGHGRTLLFDAAQLLLSNDGAAATCAWGNVPIVMLSSANTTDNTATSSETAAGKDDDGDEKMPASGSAGFGPRTQKPLQHSIGMSSRFTRKRKEPPTETTTTASSSPSADEQQEEQETDKGKKSILPSNVAVVTVASRLIRLLREIGSSSNERSFSGDLRLYMQTCWPLPKVTAAAAKAAKNKTPDLRDQMTVLVYDLLQRHFECLQGTQQHLADEDSSQQPLPRVVNDADNPAVQPLVAYYPFVSKTLEQLFQHARASLGSLPYDDQAQVRQRLECLTAAFVFHHYNSNHSQASNNTPLDARLVLMACTELTSVLSKREDHNNVLKQTKALPLPPVVPAPKRKRKTTGSSGSSGSSSTNRPYCTYAGLFPEDYEHYKGRTLFKSDGRLAILLRAMPTSAPASGAGVACWGDRIAELVSWLILIVEQSYDTRVMEQQSLTPVVAVSPVAAAAAAPVASEAKSSQRGGKKKAGRATKKRKKTTTNQAADAQDLLAALPYRQITSARALLASESLDALKNCMRGSFDDLPSLTTIQTLLRASVSTAHMNRLVDLEETLRKLFANGPTTSTADGGSSPSSTSDRRFSVEEYKLWASHMNMCICIGRGRMSSRNGESHGLLNKKRLNLFKRISSNTLSSSPGTGKRWPLWLPPSYKALVSSNVATEERANGKDAEADRYIVDGAIATISQMLKQISSFPRSEVSPEGLTAYDPVYLSLGDSRIILAALIHLPQDTRTALFASLVESVLSWFDGLDNREEDVARIRSDREVSGFVARVVVLCSNAYSLLRFGPQYRRELKNVLNAAQVPQKLSTEERPVYSSEQTFSSVLENWEFADESQDRFSLEGVDRASEADLQSVLEAAFRLGFQTASVDKCHLLFAAWNALGKCEIWSPVTAVSPLPRELVGKLSSVIVDLRNDVCFAHRLVGKAMSTDLGKSKLVQAIEDQEPRPSSKTKSEWGLLARETLVAMVKKAATVVKRAENELFVDGGDVSTEAFCLLEILPTYVSFAVSSMTRPRSNFFTSTYDHFVNQSSKRGRGYSSESENTASDEESHESQDYSVNAYQRLQDVCDMIGAVPAHPDWLDKECRLLDGVTHAMAIEFAHEAQMCMTELLAIAVRQTKLHQTRAVGAVCAESRQRQDPAAKLAVDLCWLQYPMIEALDGPADYEEEQSVFQSVGKVCRAESDIFEKIHQQVGERRDTPGIQFCKTAAQRVQGRLTSMFRTGTAANYATGPELRATEEWEVLFARGLTLAGVDDDTDLATYAAEFRAPAVLANGWQSVLWNTVENLSPVTALLRFGLSQRGREPHPLSSNEFSVDDYDSSDTSLAEDLPSGTVVAAPIKRSVMETLAALSLVLPDDLACSAAALHLVPDMNSYSTLHSIGVCRLTLGALERVHALMESRPASQRQVGIGIVERLSSVIERYGSNSATEEPDEVTQHTLLLSSMNMKMVEETKSIASQDLDLAPFWSAIRDSRLVRVPGFYGEDHNTEHLLRGLVRFVWHDDIVASERARGSLGNALCRLLWHEYEREQKPVLLMVCNLANQTSESSVESLLRSEIVGASEALACKTFDDLPLQDVRAVMCTVLSLLVSTSNFTKSNEVVKILLDTISVWGGLELKNRLLVLNLLFLHASVVGRLHVVGERLLSVVKEDEKNVENFAHFCNFVAALDSASKGGHSRSKKESGGPLQKLPAMCSYAMLSDFREQHWYHCYTCDLTGDRGCCTLCALSCHRGHDVVYARHSSFFCDCGAEESGSKCQSLSRLSPSAVDSICQDWSAQGSSAGSTTSGVKPLDLCSSTQMAATSHVEESKDAIKAFHDAARPSEWANLVFKYLSSEFKVWAGANATSSRMPVHFLGSTRSSLSRRLATAPCVASSSVIPFQSLRSLRDGSLRPLSATKRAYLRDKGICRQVLESDSRGRLAVADADNVLFCNGLSQIRGETNQSYLSRSSLYILKSVPVYFEILGLRFSTSAEGTVAVWGSNRVTILEMSSSFSTVERRTDLVIDLKSQGGSTDSVIQCHWLKGGCLAVGCRQAILLYDMDQSEKAPQVTIRPPETENELADFSVVRLTNSPADAWKIFALFKDGRLQGLRLSESTLVGSKTFILPDEGMGIMLSSSPDESPELGEYIQGGTRLSFLRQSRTLVYQGSKEALGIPVGSDGEIDRAFVLLPQSLTLPDDRLSGPYTQWTDLGLVERDGSVYFRVSCVADYFSRGQPALLLVDFNEFDTKVQKVWSEAGGQDSPFHRKFSVDGCAAFSAPVCLAEDGAVAERAYLTMVSSTGCFRIFSEGSTPSSRPSVEPFVNTRGEVLKAEEPRIEPQMPVLAFESLVNVTDSTELFLKETVESLTSDQIKTKLLRDNDLYLRSPDCDGFTLNIATKAVDNAKLRPSMAITAVRMLFGSSCYEGIPKTVSVQGKQYEILADTKRWYAFHLSAQDVLVAIRSGVISIHVSASHDSSTRPVVDALETYAVDRMEIDRWLPTSMRRLVAPCVSETAASGSSRLRLCLKAMSSLNKLLGCRPPTDEQMTLLGKLVKATALDLDRDLSEEVVSLVSSFESSIDDTQAFLDSGAISCCSQFLSECDQALKRSGSSGNEEDCSQFWQGLRSLFRACLRVAAGVARLRPKNYLKAIADCPQSIAVRAGALMDVFFVQSSVSGDVVSDFVELSLLESAVARGYGADYDSRGRLAGFDILHRLLVSPNNLIVQHTCSAISDFCEKYSLAERLGNDEVDLFAAKPMIEYYECDGCGLFPIVDTRYSFNDEDRPVDLCSDCFQIAKDFAASKKFDDNQDVVVRDRTVGGGPQLSCAEVATMEAVPIRNSAAPEMEESSSAASQGRSGAKESLIPGSSQAEVFQRQQLFDVFMDGLFSMIISLLSTELERQELSVSALLSLVFELTRCSENGGKKTDRASRLARKLVEGLSRSMQRYQSSSLDSQPSLRKLEICIVRYLMALSTLVVPDNDARAYLIYPNNEALLPVNELSEQRATPKCEHGSAAVRHVFAKGSNCNRAFYCCGTKSKAHRCNFFVWSSDESENQAKSVYNENIAKLIWTSLSQPQPKDAVPLFSSICALVKKSMERNDLFSAGVSESRKGNTQLERRQKNIHQTLADFADGVWCSKERLQTTMMPYSFYRGPKSTREYGLVNVDRDIVEASLELMALVAQPDAPGVSDWFSPLCLVLLSQREGAACFQPQAKRALWQLCGKTADQFTAVRDSYLFKMQFEEVLKGASPLRDYCLLVNQKAEQQIRNQRRNDSPKLTSQDLRLRDIVGAVDLMNEDVCLRDLGSVVEKAMEELLTIAKKRRHNWMKFCFSASLSDGSTDQKSAPIDELVVLACLLSGDLQIKAMELASLALPPRVICAPPSYCPPSPTDPLNMKEEPAPHELGPHKQSGVECDDLYAFVVRFVCSDESQDIRRLAVRVAVGLCEQGSFASDLIVRLTKKPMALVGKMGKLSSDFLVLLNELVTIAQTELADVNSLASTVSLLFQKQTLATRFDRPNGESFHFETRSTSSIQKNRFELARCAHVVLRQSPAAKKAASSKTKRLPEQVSPFARMRLEMGRSSASSNEFNSFIVLPYRCVVSEIHVSVCDHRGRYVKKLNFYCSPRPVKSPSRLKVPEYNGKWQLCGSLELPRGAEKVSCTLKRPVLASNLRIEYAEFYDRPGSPKSDGFVVHCPRCTRIVTNAHGVCASCGEVAFQCRRCRHINYDRLDAFLCIECGFCASGSFSYEITCGIASNAIAISNDHDYRHATNMFSTASWLFEEIRGVLHQKLVEMSDRGNKSLEPPLGGSDAVKRALEGKLPLLPGGKDEPKTDSAQSLLKRFNKRGSIVKLVAKKGSSRSSSQGRSDSTSTIRIIRSHRGGGENSNNNVGDEEDEEALASDLLGGLLESAGMARGSLDPSDPVSRFLASVHNRARERRSATNAQGEDGGGDGGSPSGTARNDSGAAASTPPPSKNKMFEECERLYRLMHEAQRECFALERRLEAWRRLESGDLCFYAGQQHDGAVNFEPSHCSTCSGVVSHQLLILWQSLFRADPANVEVSNDMLALLLSDDPATSTRALQESKLSAVKDIALQSEKYRPMVLEALRVRLLPFGDAHCAEIVGKILKEGTDATIAEPFVALAREVMESNPVL